MASIGTLGGVLGISISDILMNIDHYQASLQEILSSINLYANHCGFTYRPKLAEH
ncbi:hypothetical protein O9929_24610 [Vibrio lentus]|nr:hypothetical protein [Vibrio lentus]